MCDVYERDLANVRLGDAATIHMTAYPDEVVKGTVSNIGAVLDPNLRTAKVRIEVKNPGEMRLGMFVTATFQAQAPVTYTAVPASAVMRLHDRDWVYMAAVDKKFRQARSEAGLPEKLVLYCGRHDYGTRVLQGTGNLAVVMRAMGHGSPSTAMKYQHPELEQVRRVLKRDKQQLPTATGIEWHILRHSN